MRNLHSLPTREAGFVEPMECLAVAKLPDGPEWVYEIKLDGYRAVAIKSNGKLSLCSRKRKSFNRQYLHILQHSRSQASRICYFVFDLLVYENRDSRNSRLSSAAKS
jgi:ATP-dependent DNA ligase